MAQARRIMVVGTSGAGKTTFARALGAALSLPVIDLDAINWQANWHDLATHDPALFHQRVADAAARANWVSDGNYSLVRPLLLARATDLVWLDYARSLIMRRVVRRSIGRAVSGTELWPGTGNVETARRWLQPDHPIRWAWSTYADRRKRYAALAAALPDHITLHHLRRPREASALLRALAAGHEAAGQPADKPLAD